MRGQFWIRLCGAAVLFAAATSMSAAATLSISSIQDLRFGSFARGTGGTVSIAVTGMRSATGGAVLLTAASGQAAKFQVTGTPNQTFAITLPAVGSVALTNAGGQSMPLDDFVSSPTTTGTLSVSGVQTFCVGARLTVSSGQATGNYSGSFNVYVDYN